MIGGLCTDGPLISSASGQMYNICQTKTACGCKKGRYQVK